MLPWTMMSAGCDVPSSITISSSAMCDRMQTFGPWAPLRTASPLIMHECLAAGGARDLWDQNNDTCHLPAWPPTVGNTEPAQIHRLRMSQLRQSP